MSGLPQRELYLGMQFGFVRQKLKLKINRHAHYTNGGQETPPPSWNHVWQLDSGSWCSPWPLIPHVLGGRARQDRKQ